LNLKFPLSRRQDGIVLLGNQDTNRTSGECSVDFVEAVILDIDGTLLDSNDAHARAYLDAATSLGLTSDFQMIRRIIGKGSDKLIPEAFGFDAESDRGKELDAMKGKIFKTRYLPTLRPTPGARELLLRLRRDGMKLVVATSAGKEDVDPLLERAGVKDLLQETTSADDAEASKPEPDVITAALKQVDAQPDHAIMLGDTPYDVEAASRAGVKIIAFRSGGWRDEDLHGALAVYDHAAHLLLHYDESVLGQRRQ
jgi:HAD superfamily hydrolase (TIGR01509 family)